MSEPFDQLEPDAVASSERFIDALAQGAPVDGDPGDRALAELLEDWRDDLRMLPTVSVCPEQEAAAALARVLAARRRAGHRTALVGAVAAAVLSVAGFGVLMGQAQPGDPLYGARTSLFGESAAVHDEQIAVSAESEMNDVEQMIATGQWDQAHDKLAAVGAHVQTVKDADRKQVLIDHMNRLTAKVVSRDAHATPLPGNSGTVLAPNAFGG
jgi:hypothetical protein